VAGVAPDPEAPGAVVVVVVPGAVVAGTPGDVDDGGGIVVEGGTPVRGVMTVPGGACGDGRSVPGGAVGSEGTGRPCGGTGWRCSVPGGRVASRWVGLCLGEAGRVCAGAIDEMVSTSAKVCSVWRKRRLNIKPKTPRENLDSRSATLIGKLCVLWTMQVRGSYVTRGRGVSKTYKPEAGD